MICLFQQKTSPDTIIGILWNLGTADLDQLAFMCAVLADFSLAMS